MANTHGQISRLGICLQYGKSLLAFPGWGTDFVRSRAGNPAGWMGDVLGAANFPPPKWVGDTPGGKLITSREFLHSLTNYPGKANEVWRYACDLEVGGQSRSVAIALWAATLARDSHRGIDKGGKSGRVIVEAMTFTFTDASVINTLVNTVIFDTINGWNERGKIWKWSNFLAYPKDILRVRISLRVEMGTEQFHDDKSWTPQGVIGNEVFGVGYNFGVPDGSVVGWVDRENTYLVTNNTGVPVLLPAKSSVGRSGLYEYIGSTAVSGGYGSGGYQSLSSAGAGSLW